jgi:hypothetical protein
MPDRHDDLDEWLDERIEPLSPPPGTFDAIRRRARRRKYRKLAVSAAAAAAIIAAGVAVPQFVKLPIENAKTVAGGAPSPSETAAPHPTGGPNVEGQSASPVPLPSGNPVPPNFQPSSLTAVSSKTIFTIGQAGTPGRCATIYCTSMARTQDAGATWTGLPAPLTGSPDGATGVGQVRFLEGINGWAFGPELWSTHDGGERWKQIGTSGQRVIDVETVGERAFAIEATCTGTGADYATQCTSFTLYSTPAKADDWTKVGGSTTRLTASSNIGSGNTGTSSTGTSSGSTSGGAATAGTSAGSAALILTGSRGYLLAPDGTLYSGPVNGKGEWQGRDQIPCSPGQAQGDGEPSGALLGALTPTSLILTCTQSRAVYVSTDSGKSWQQTSTTPEGISATSIAASQAATVILAASQGIEVLPTGTTTWRAATLTSTTGSASGSGPAGGFSYVGMTNGLDGMALPANPADGAVWFTTDGGLSWAPSVVQGSP